MRRATRILASALGAFAGFGGPEHGIFEIMRGNIRPELIRIWISLSNTGEGHIEADGYRS